MANLYVRQGRLADGEALYLRALSIREKALGNSHPAVAVVLSNLARLYRKQNRDAEAEALQVKAAQVMARHRDRNPTTAN